MIQFTQEQINQLDKYFYEPRNLVDLFEGTAAKWGDRPSLGQKDPNTRQFVFLTYRQLAERIDNLRGALKKLGLQKGETVGVILSNSIEWFVLENATHGLGGRFIPMYEKELLKKWNYMVRDSSVKFLFVRNQAILDKVKGFTADCPELKEIFVVYGEGEKSLAALEKMGSANPTPSYKPHWSEIAVIIYTSGTTGDPKGVVLTHGNLTHCSQAGYRVYPELCEKSVALSILPWAHSYAVSGELHNFIQFGGSIGVMESLDTLTQDIQAVRPTHLIAVPRVWNKIYNGIQMAMEEAGGIKKKLFDAACEEAKKCRGKKKSLKLRLLDKLVFDKVRARFGGRLIGSLTASAVMNLDIALFFDDIGVKIYDCYGLSETSPAITMNAPAWGNKIGSVGKPLMDWNVVLDKSRIGDGSPDGEIIVYGPQVMMGYLNKPEMDAAIFMPDTWNGFPGIRTGDLGRFDEEGFLYVTGRYKDEYKLSNGKYVHPESIETDMKLVPHVSNAFVYGSGKEYNVGIIVPDFATIRKDHHTAKWAALSPAELINNQEFRDFLIIEVNDQLKKNFASYEIPRKYLITDQDFTLENGMLTQTLKVVRGEVEKNYGDILNRLYTE
ncbi:MAG TPA: AMP-binding protein [Spirochaetota bacterium]|nr:AMP-binding protein [Spirochaetota bacterium]HOD16660.1 AMP-binding protein [Spirochaetota bacterium]HPG50393.1 AMP-binding protein [Spirochaetota bacterium]HPN12551.1 AMP-binding protein [Spirochaetota bacterium]HQL82445.1 AMP-binding protein [Spirochaetota bacterium]